MLEIEHFPSGISRITLDRPDRHNTLNGALIGRLGEAFSSAEIRGARAVILTGNGHSFCAGSDPEWIDEARHFPKEQVLKEATAFADCLAAIDRCPAPVIAAVHGFCLGGGLGLVAAADMVTAHPETRFSFNEVKIGIAPANIAPYVLRAIGVRQGRRLMLTGERFSAEQALVWGLVHDVRRAPRQIIEDWLGHILEIAPGVIEKTKEMIDTVANRPITDELRHEGARQIARDHVTPEGREGMDAFVEKRKPSWCPDE